MDMDMDMDMACAHLGVAGFVNAKVLGLEIAMHHAGPVQRLGVGFRGRVGAMARGGARAKFRVRVRGKVRVSVQCLEPKPSRSLNLAVA